METAKEYRILDLFCGAGGFSFGMHMNKHFKTVVASDFNENAIKTFKANMPETHTIVGDITNPTVRQNIIETSKQCHVNMIVGGPPCQGFAMKGKKLGLNDDRNFLFLEYLKIVKELSPDVFVIENVRQILTSSNGFFKNEIIQYIKKLGYYVDYGVLNAKNFGVPQSRERAIFICSKEKTIALPTEEKTIVTVRDAISDLAYLESGKGSFKMEYVTKPQSAYQIEQRKRSKYLYNHQATNHSKGAIDKLKMIPPEKGKEFLPEHLRGKQQYHTTWCRLVWDDVSPTIDTRFDTPSNGTNSHPYLNRSITPREAARLQSFSDDFVFYGNKSAVCTQIGNAVPPLLAKAIADKIQKDF